MSLCWNGRSSVVIRTVSFPVVEFRILKAVYYLFPVTNHSFFFWYNYPWREFINLFPNRTTNPYWGQFLNGKTNLFHSLPFVSCAKHRKTTLLCLSWSHGRFSKESFAKAKLLCSLVEWAAPVSCQALLLNAQHTWHGARHSAWHTVTPSTKMCPMN